MTWPDIEPEAPSRPSVPVRTWVIGVALGVVASVVASVPLFYLGLGQQLAVVGGLVAGGVVCGVLTRRRGPLQWAGAFVLVFLAQLGLGVLALAAAPPA
jgi:hypothetical protein